MEALAPGIEKHEEKKSNRFSNSLKRFSEKAKNRLSTTNKKSNTKDISSSNEQEVAKHGTEKTPDQERGRELRGKVHESPPTTVSMTPIVEREHVYPNKFRPYTVSDAEREQYQRLVLGMDDAAIRKADIYKKRTYDVEVLW